MAETTPKTEEQEAREYLAKLLQDGFVPAESSPTENRKARAAEFTAYALGELVKEIRELNRNIWMANNRG